MLDGAREDGESGEGGDGGVHGSLGRKVDGGERMWRFDWLIEESLNSYCCSENWLPCNCTGCGCGCWRRLAAIQEGRGFRSRWVLSQKAGGERTKRKAGF